ncbi:universal stress protein [Kineococcus gynurae]|uniref:Universal stress protein n=1 Tax=Kineococcus gynurae TaxID=452979 RepID=A0ABV5LXH2_9ACTN
MSTSTAGRIVVATQDRPEGIAALRWALDRAQEQGAKITVVPTTGDSPGTPVHVSEDFRSRVRAIADTSGAAYELHETLADIALTLVELSAEADLVVLPVKRRSATMKFLLGSIAQRVIGEAACPVVTVKA